MLLGLTTLLVAVPAAQAHHQRHGRSSQRARVVLKPVRGHVSVNGVRLTRTKRVRFGVVIDTVQGVVQVAVEAQGKVEKAQFSKGVFRLTQAKKSGLVTATLVHEHLADCKAQRSPAAVAKKPKPKPKPKKHKKHKKQLARLLINGHGKFQSEGRYAAAASHGTRWLLTDRCNGTSVHVYTDTVTVHDFVRHKTVVVHAGQTYLAAALSIATSRLPSGAVGTVYSQKLQGSGGSPPYTWSISGGSLPSGLTLSSSGDITGTPTTVETSTFTVELTDAANNQVNQAITIRIHAFLISVSNMAVCPKTDTHNSASTYVECNKDWSASPFSPGNDLVCSAESLDGAGWTVTMDLLHRGTAVIAFQPSYPDNTRWYWELDYIQYPIPSGSYTCEFKADGFTIASLNFQIQ